MSGVTRREALGVAAVGALGMAMQGYAREAPGAQEGQGADGSHSQGTIDIKIAVQGLTVIHRVMEEKNLKFIRLALIDPTKTAVGHMPHSPILGVPQAIIDTWPHSLPPLMTTMDYVFWSMAGWKGAAMEVATDKEKYSVGGKTSVHENYKAIKDKGDCAEVRSNWLNTDLIVRMSDVTSKPALKADWHESPVVTGYLDLPYGTIEDARLTAENVHEKFNDRIFSFTSENGSNKLPPRAMKNIARLLLPGVKGGGISTPGGDIVFRTTLDDPQRDVRWDYDHHKLPVLVSNLDMVSHIMDGKDFRAYYDILESPPELDDRLYPVQGASCERQLRTVQCGCCPPIMTP